MRETVQKKECPEALYVQHLGINFPLQVVIRSIFNPKTTKTTNRFLLNFRRDDGGMHSVESDGLQDAKWSFQISELKRTPNTPPQPSAEIVYAHALRLTACPPPSPVRNLTSVSI